MRVLIKGMDMPKCCADCPLNDEYDDCGALDTDYYTEGKYTGRLPNCPLVEVPTPHGRLIDADELMKVIKEYDDEFGNEIEHGRCVSFLATVLEMPTIIEAEGITNDEL